MDERRLKSDARLKAFYDSATHAYLQPKDGYGRKTCLTRAERWLKKIFTYAAARPATYRVKIQRELTASINKVLLTLVLVHKRMLHALRLTRRASADWQQAHCSPTGLFDAGCD